MVKYLFLLVVIINQLRIMLTQMSFLGEAKPRFFFGAARSHLLNTMPPPPPPPPPPHLSSSMWGLLFFFGLFRQSLLGKLGRFLFLLAGTGFLLVALTACAGGGGGSGSSSGPGNTPGPGDNPDTESPEEVKPGFTFAPIEGGFRIGNQSLDFGEFVSLNITATNVNSGEITHANLSLAEFIDSSYDFLSLDDQSNYTFMIEGIFINGTRQEVPLVLVWEENIEDYAKGGLRPGLDTDGDRRANSVDTDDDNDGLLDVAEVYANGTALVNTTSGIGCSLLADCDADGLGDNDEKERQTNLAGESCSVLADCDGDTVRDIDEAAVNCVIEADCDADGFGDADSLERMTNLAGESCSVLKDCDGDNVADGLDIDRDGDGLIEIGTAEELNGIRYALDGSGRQLEMGGTLNTSGCASSIECAGYELIADISIQIYAGGNGWRPLGHDTGSSSGCQGDPFNGTFEGNDWTISGLRIIPTGQDCVGLFGHIAAGSEIRNLRLSAERVGGRDHVGALVGWGEAIRIVSSSVVVGGDGVAGRDRVGGLVGSGALARIVSSSVMGEVSGRGDRVGGLVGHGEAARIDSSSVMGEVSGNDNIGGLVGHGEAARIDSSSVMGEVSGNDNIGGLVGHGEAARIDSSSVMGEVSGNDNIGGLVGSGPSARIDSSSVEAAKVSGNDNIGGLVGHAEDARIVSSSVEAAKVSGNDNIGGLVGSGPSAQINSSSVMGNLSGDDNIGGLVGEGRNAEIHFSSVVVGNLSGQSVVGGLMGDGSGAEVHSSSVEAVEVSGDASVGGLVGGGNAVEIRSSSVVAAKLIGRVNILGGLLGSSDDVRIINSSVLAGEVKGVNTVGGLVGSAGGAQVYSSSVLVDSLSGNDDVGGLMGMGRASATRIIGSFAVAASVNGSGDRTGGLIGNAERARIVASFVVAGDIRGKDLVGGMLGIGGSGRIISSFVVAEEVSGGSAGGLVSIHRGGLIFHSYLVVGNSPQMLAFSAAANAVPHASYWDRDTSGNNVAAGLFGRFQETVDLQMPTDYDGIYATWDDGVRFFDGHEIANITIWCDRDNSENIEEAERDPANRIWDFGTENEYPVVRCSSLSPAEVRSWWFLDKNHKPQLNQTRLDEALKELPSLD